MKPLRAFSMLRAWLRTGMIWALVGVGVLVGHTGHFNTVMAAQGPLTEPANPYLIRIDIRQPVLTVYKNGRSIRSYPVVLGRPETQTPVGNWRIIDKQKNWGDGFGSRWLALNVPWGIYGIHGTNRPEYIGTYASNGCIRMRNVDVEQLYDLVPKGTPVNILGDPLRYIRTLRYGNIGADVQLVQQRLKELGYFRGECDGRFGPVMEFGLIYYELSERLPMDGEVGMDDYRTLGLIQIH